MMKSIIRMIAICALISPIPASAGQVNHPRRGSFSIKPARIWQEAMVTGNGQMGVMVFGDPHNEKIIFNHERLFEPLRNTLVKAPEVAQYLPELRQMLLAGKYKEGNDWFYQKCLEVGYPGLLWTDPYHPAYEMKIVFQPQEPVSNYRRSLDFTTGQVSITWNEGDTGYVRRIFVSRPDNVIVQDIRSSSGKNVSCRIAISTDWLKEYNTKKHKNGGFQTPQIKTTPESISFQLAYEKTDRGYEGLTRVIVDGGKSSVANGQLRIKDAKSVLLISRITPLENAADSQLDQTRQSLSKLNTNYDQLLAPHAKIHGDMFNRISLDLAGSDEQRQWSNEQLIQAQKKLDEGQINPVLLEKMFDMGRFTIICSNGQLPPNLMGVWNGEGRPDWSGDYTLDANINLQVSAVNLADLPECFKSYSNLIEEIIPSWRENAQRLYGCRGVMGGTRTSGRENHHVHHGLTLDFPGFFWTAAAQWLALPMIEYYEVSGDKDYLRKTLLPLMEEIVLFYEDFLTETDDQGYVVFVPSYSPENRPENQKTSAAINATMDLAVAKEALVYTIRFSQELDRNADKIERWQRLLKKIPPYRINEDGALAEWAHPDLHDRYNHRHVSHLYPLWPGHEINPEQTPELFDAAKVAAHKRGRGNNSAHGLAHMALIGTRLKDAELVHGNLSFMLSNDFLLPSLFTYHNPNRIYNSDMLHSLPAVVMEMLVYSRPGLIELLPALSDKLANGSISGVKCRGRMEVENLTWDLEAKKLSVILVSDIDQKVELMVRRGIDSVNGFNETVKDGNSISLDLKKDRPIKLEIRIQD